MCTEPERRTVLASDTVAAVRSALARKLRQKLRPCLSAELARKISVSAASYTRLRRASPLLAWPIVMGCTKELMMPTAKQCHLFVRLMTFLLVTTAMSAGCSDDSKPHPSRADARPDTGQVQRTQDAAADDAATTDRGSQLPGPPAWVAAGTSAPRLRHTATLLDDGRVLIVGGQSDDEGAASALQTAEIFDPATGSYMQAADLPGPRFQHSMTRLADGRVLVAGGVDQQGNKLANAVVYNPADDSWSSMISMGAARPQHSATRVADGSVWLIGGFGGSSSAVASVERFDPATNSFAPLQVALQSARAQHAAVLLDDGRLWVVGGTGGVRVGALDSAEVIDPTSGRAFVTLSSTMSVTRSEVFVAKLNDGRVLITGRTTVLSDAAEIFVPEGAEGGQFRQTGSMTRTRVYHGLTVLPTGPLAGFVLVSGGRSGRSLADCELYNPASDTFVATASFVLSAGRHSHAPVALPDGRVFVYGGWSNGSGATTGELFEQRDGL